MKYANLYLYSEAYPYEIVRSISDKTIEIRSMKATLDPEWKPEIHAGGFAGHCSNQHQQKWIYESDESAPVIRARKRKDGKFYSAYGRHAVQDFPKRFYDYNF